MIGQDYVSRVCQGVADLVEEVNPAFAATMGGIPGGTAGSPADPSMAHAVELAVADAQAITLARLGERPNLKIVTGGYSAGAGGEGRGRLAHRLDLAASDQRDAGARAALGSCPNDLLAPVDYRCATRHYAVSPLVMGSPRPESGQGH